MKKVDNKQIIDKNIKYCPDCGKSTEFGEICDSCANLRESENTYRSGYDYACGYHD